MNLRHVARGAALTLLAFVGGCGAHASTVTIAGPSDAKWTTQIQGMPLVLMNAQPGDVIVLQAGDYPPLETRFGLSKPSPGVTITAAKGAKVVLESLNITSGGWRFASGEGAILVHGEVKVSNAADVVLDGLEIAGEVPDDLTKMAGVGISYRNVTNLTVTHCKIHHWEVDVAGLHAKGLTLTDNVFSDTSSDLVHLGGDLSNAQIGRNLFTEVHTVDLVHQDALQIFPNYATGPMDSISIFDNRIIRGSGGAPVQGIFMNGDNKTPYTNLKITGNMVMSGNWWGIGVQAARNFVVANNYVGGYTDALNDGQVMQPWIKVADSADGVVENNVINSPLQIDNSRRIKDSHQKFGDLAAPNDLRAAEAWWSAKASRTAPAPAPAAPAAP